MNGFRLARIAPPGVPGEWPIPATRQVLLGRAHPGGAAPEVDLWPDMAVSRRQAVLWRDAAGTWIRDLGSTNRTAVDDDPLPVGTATHVAAGSVITVGVSKLLVLGPESRLLRLDQACLEFGAPVALGFSLARHGWVPFDRVVAHNPAGRPTAQRQIRLTLPPYAAASLVVPPMAGGARRRLVFRDVQVDELALRRLGDRRWAAWRVEVGGEPIGFTEQVGGWILPPDEFAFDPRHRIALAAFVQPNHPRIVRVAGEAGIGHGPSADSSDVLRAIYEHLRSSWFLTYRQEPPRFGADAQRVRLAHDVLTDLHRRTGHGTCLDLALVIAAIGESLGIQPLIAIVDLGSTHHALVGCWLRRGMRLDPLPSSVAALVTGTAWVDPNGCTRDPTQERGFDLARADALRLLQEAPFQFALDIHAARQDGVVPLPIIGEPQRDPMT